MPTVRRLLGITLGMLIASSPAFAVNEYYQYSCDSTIASPPGPTSPCVTKPPKERVMVSVSGDYDANGTSPELSVTLAKGGKKQLVTVGLTYEYYSLSGQFRPLTVRVNDKYTPPNFVILNHLPQCTGGFCVVHADYWFDIAELEASYLTQFYGQPLKVDLEASTKNADAGSQYNATLIARVEKKK